MATGQGGAAGSFRGPAGPRGSPRPPSGRGSGRGARLGGAARPRKFVPSGALRPAPTAPARPGPGAASAGGASSRAVRSPPGRGSWERAPGRRGCAALLCAGRPRRGSRRGWSGPAGGGREGAFREVVGARGTQPPRARGAGLYPETRPGAGPAGGPTASGSRGRCTAIHGGRAVVRRGPCGGPPTGRGVVPPPAVRSSSPPAPHGPCSSRNPRRRPAGARSDLSKFASRSARVAPRASATLSQP